VLQLQEGGQVGSLRQQRVLTPGDQLQGLAGPMAALEARRDVFEAA
jgi:hypothetical protein